MILQDVERLHLQAGHFHVVDEDRDVISTFAKRFDFECYVFVSLK